MDSVTAVEQTSDKDVTGIDLSEAVDTAISEEPVHSTVRPEVRSAVSGKVETVASSQMAITEVDGKPMDTLPTEDFTTTEPIVSNMNGTSNKVYHDPSKYTFAAIDSDQAWFYFNNKTGAFQTSSNLFNRGTHVWEIAFATDKNGAGNVYALFYDKDGNVLKTETFPAGVNKQVSFGDDYRIYYSVREENGKKYPTLSFDRTKKIEGWFDETYTNYEKALSNTDGRYVGYGYFVPTLVDKETDYVVDGTGELIGRVTQTQLSGYKFKTSAPKTIVANGNTYELIPEKTIAPEGTINPLVNAGDVISVGTDANHIIRYEFKNGEQVTWQLLTPDGTPAKVEGTDTPAGGTLNPGQISSVTVVVPERVTKVSGGRVTYYIPNPYFKGGKTTYYYKLVSEAPKKDEPKEEVKKSTLVHEFVSGTPGKELPKEVTDLTPAKKPDVVYGTTEHPVYPNSTTVTVTDGTWTFKSYDKTSELVDQLEEKFTGTWVFGSASPVVPEVNQTPETTADKPQSSIKAAKPVAILPETGDGKSALTLVGVALLGTALLISRRREESK